MGENCCFFAKQMRIDNRFVELASESPLTSSDRAVYLAKNS